MTGNLNMGGQMITNVSSVPFSEMWFVDRMVWLYDIMSTSIPEYQTWKTGPGHLYLHSEPTDSEPPTRR